MSRVLLAWLGKADINAARGESPRGPGPIAEAIATRGFDHLVILDDHKAGLSDAYCQWLRGRDEVPVEVRPVSLAGPTNYAQIHDAAAAAAAWALERFGKGTKLVFHLSPGTSAMTAIWIILAKTQFPAELIESSPEAGVVTAEVPFEMAAELIPAALRRSQAELERLGAGARPPAAFASIVHRSPALRVVVEEAVIAASYATTPVLIQGESGTGKELFAAAIHAESPRRAGRFVPVNCGAIPPDLFESEFFGHDKGAFTGATSDRPGLFEEAEGGTLFLDEVGELPPLMQVKLLRALQSKRVRRVGGGERSTDVRVISATNRDLLHATTTGAFREDLFYRLAVLVLRVPALRDRREDIGLLADHFVSALNEEASRTPGRSQKKLSPGARNVILRHGWPGNVRELENTVHRAFIWSRGLTIERVDVEHALLVRPGGGDRAVLGQPLGDGFDLERVIASVARHYLARALDEAHRNKTRAAALIGFKSQQRMTTWLKKYKVS